MGSSKSSLDSSELLAWARSVTVALQHVTWQLASHVIQNIGTRHTSHVTRHTSHVTRHTSHVTRHLHLQQPLSISPSGWV